jgi:hypothetical protein
VAQVNVLSYAPYFPWGISRATELGGVTSWVQGPKAPVLSQDQYRYRLEELVLLHWFPELSSALRIHASIAVVHSEVLYGLGTCRSTVVEYGGGGHRLRCPQRDHPQPRMSANCLFWLLFSTIFTFQVQKHENSHS